MSVRDNNFVSFDASRRNEGTDRDRIFTPAFQATDRSEPFMYNHLPKQELFQVNFTGKANKEISSYHHKTLDFMSKTGHPHKMEGTERNFNNTQCSSTSWLLHGGNQSQASIKFG